MREGRGGRGGEEEGDGEGEGEGRGGSRNQKRGVLPHPFKGRGTHSWVKFAVTAQLI